MKTISINLKKESVKFEGRKMNIFEAKNRRILGKSYISEKSAISCVERKGGTYIKWEHCQFGFPPKNGYLKQYIHVPAGMIIE